MSLTVTRGLLVARTPLVCTLRNRTPDIRVRDIPHWKRAVVLKITKPVYKDPNADKHPIELCTKQQKIEEKANKQKNPFEEILAREIYEKFETAKLVAIFHKLPMNSTSLFSARVLLNKINMKYVHHNNNIMKLAFTGTKYEALLKLYESTSITFTGDQLAVGKLLKLQKRIPSLVLVAGVVEGRLLSVEGLKEYASLPTLEVMQAQVVHTLSAASRHISQNFTAHQMELASSLTRYINAESSTDASEEDK